MNNLVEFEILKIENINSPIKELEGKISCKLTVDLRADNDVKVFIAIKKS